ncbi:MAG: hypothetical protein V7K85_12955 [Nostoc sp.]
MNRKLLTISSSYTNAKVGLDAYPNSDASAVSINGGLGYRFK